MTSGSNVGSVTAWVGGALLLVVGSFLPITCLAVESDFQKCVAAEASFDGITPLEYADVVASNGEHVPLSHEPTPDAGKSPYLIRGDAVAIGKKCGDWVYVQYIGTSKITLGWLKAGQLKMRPRPEAPADADNGRPPRHFPFELTRGAGVPVCEAYLTTRAHDSTCTSHFRRSVPQRTTASASPLPISCRAMS